MTTQERIIDIPYEEKMRVFIDTTRYEYDRVYNALYDLENLEDIIDNSWLWDELIEKTENYLKTREGKEFIKYWSKYKHDLITSDREYKALAIALDL